MDMFSWVRGPLSFVYEQGSLPGDQASPRTHKERMSDQRGQGDGCSDGWIPPWDASARKKPTAAWAINAPFNIENACPPGTAVRDRSLVRPTDLCTWAPSYTGCLRSHSPITSECDWVRGRAFNRWSHWNETIWVGPLQSDWCPYKKLEGPGRHGGILPRGTATWRGS